MKVEDFDAIVENRLGSCRETLVPKGEEYSRNRDRLWNFKAAARKRGCTPEEALQGMHVKHLVSVDDIVQDAIEGKHADDDLLAEKFGDTINYYLLLEAQLRERRGDGRREYNKRFVRVEITPQDPGAETLVKVKDLNGDDVESEVVYPEEDLMRGKIFNPACWRQECEVRSENESEGAPLMRYCDLRRCEHRVPGEDPDTEQYRPLGDNISYRLCIKTACLKRVIEPEAPSHVDPASTCSLGSCSYRMESE